MATFNVPSKSLISVRRMKSRVSSKKRSLPHAGSISVRNFPQIQVKTKKKRNGLRRKLVLFQSGILPQNSGEDQKKVFAAFWFYLIPEFRIYCAHLDFEKQFY